MAKSIGFLDESDKNYITESFLHMAGQMYPGHTFAIENSSLMMDEKFLCEYTIERRIVELWPKCVNAIDAEVEALSEQFEEIERLTGFERETAWANL